MNPCIGVNPPIGVNPCIDVNPGIGVNQCIGANPCNDVNPRIGVKPCIGVNPEEEAEAEEAEVEVEEEAGTEEEAEEALAAAGGGGGRGGGRAGGRAGRGAPFSTKPQFQHFTPKVIFYLKWTIFAKNASNSKNTQNATARGFSGVWAQKLSMNDRFYLCLRHGGENLYFYRKMPFCKKKNSTKIVVWE